MSSRYTHVIAVALTLIPAHGAAAQSQTDLSGRWIREASLGAAMDDIAPAWEDISNQDRLVTIRRAPAEGSSGTLLQSGSTSAVLPEVYASDGVERSTQRAKTTRLCRSEWQASQFVIECRDTDRGPGGSAPEILTREVRSIDSEGRLVLELTWRSDDRVVTRRAVFRRAEQ
jgi:hypothetical protein